MTAYLAVEEKDLKSLRESLCMAQSALTYYPYVSRDNELVYRGRIQEILDRIDEHRPLGSNGKHGNLHTDTCGCEDKPMKTNEKSKETIERAKRIEFPEA